jgi:hypothetical protein
MRREALYRASPRECEQTHCGQLFVMRVGLYSQRQLWDLRVRAINSLSILNLMLADGASESDGAGFAIVIDSQDIG